MDYEVLVLKGLLDSLLGGLELDFACLFLNEAVWGEISEMVRCSTDVTPDDIRASLDPLRALSPDEFPLGLSVCDITLALHVIALGNNGGFGRLVVGSRRSGFPLKEERLVLAHAVRQATIGLEQARESRHFLLNDIAGSVASPIAFPKPKADIEVINRRLMDFFGKGPDGADPWKVPDLARREDLRDMIAAQGALRDPEGNILRWLELIIDIDGRERAEDALRARELHLRQLTETIPFMLWSAAPDGNIDYFNSRLLEFTGLAAEQARGFGWLVAVHPEDAERTRLTWETAVATGEPYEIDVRIRAADQTYRWLLMSALPLRDTQGQILKWYGGIVDIHDQNEAKEVLAASERRLQLILDTMPAMVWSAHSDGRGDFANERFRSYLGLSTEEARDWGWTAAVHPDDLPGLMDSWQAMMEATSPGESEARLRRFDGKYRWFLCRGNPFVDASGNVKWFGVNVDIDDWKQSQDELREAHAELAHMTRVMAMGQLTAAIAHELTQPLSGIMTNSSTGLRMLSAEPPNVTGARETVRRTIRDADRASEVINRLRALYSRSDPVVEVVDLNMIAREVVAFALNELRRNGVSLRINLADGLPPVMGDRVQLQQVIFNFIKNGTEAMNGIVDRPRDLEISTACEEVGHVRLAVKDAGVGFDPVMSDKLFSPFFTTKTNGMGVGLSVSRSIVENHNGRLWAEANNGPGATFAFSIPSRAGNGLASDGAMA